MQFNVIRNSLYNTGAFINKMEEANISIDGTYDHEQLDWLMGSDDVYLCDGLMSKLQRAYLSKIATIKVISIDLEFNTYDIYVLT